MQFISEIKIKLWDDLLARYAQRREDSKAAAARRELHCWEYMAGVEKHVSAIIEQTRKTANVPGELRYHIEALARHVDTSTAVAARITKRIGDSERGGTGRAATGLDAAAASTQGLSTLNSQPSTPL